MESFSVDETVFATPKKAVWKSISNKEIESMLEVDILTYETIKFSAVLIEPLLGTVPKDKELFTNFIAEKMGNFQGTKLKTMEDFEEELETVPEGRGETGFHKDDDGVFIYNYMMLGNLKTNIKMLIDNGAIKKITNYKKACDLYIEIFPRRIRFHRDSVLIKEAEGSLERSLRAVTPRGPRTFLTKSEMILEGARFSFQVKILKNVNGLTPEAVIEAVKIAKIHGMGQWRGSGKYGKYRIIRANK